MPGILFFIFASCHPLRTAHPVNYSYLPPWCVAVGFGFLEILASTYVPGPCGRGSGPGPSIILKNLNFQLYKSNMLQDHI